MLSREEILAVYETGPEAVIAVVERLQAQQAELMAQVQTLTERVQALAARLNKGRQNSHKPPSSDGLAKLAPGAAGASTVARHQAGSRATPARL